jgi:hypothetical protein
MNAQWSDSYSIAELFLISVVIMVAFIEVGFRIGARAEGKAVKLQAAQVRAIMGASLGLVAFMLAFTFAVSQSHYELRVQNMVEEARLARNAFMQAEFLKESDRLEARHLLHQYIEDRVQIGSLARQHKVEEIRALIKKSEWIQGRLWQLAVANQLNGPEPGRENQRHEPFMGMVTGLVDIHAMRLQASLMNRISGVIWAALYLTSVLSMLIMGFQAGLTGRRSPIATYSLAVAFSVVMMLITDLDRPFMSLFKIDNQVVVNLLEQMDSASLGSDLAPDHD